MMGFSSVMVEKYELNFGLLSNWIVGCQLYLNSLSLMLITEVVLKYEFFICQIAFELLSPGFPSRIIVIPTSHATSFLNNLQQISPFFRVLRGHLLPAFFTSSNHYVMLQTTVDLFMIHL
jgi:hypothetical protein